MKDDDETGARIKQILRQVSGHVREDDGELVPEMAIKGTGDMFCYAPSSRRFIRITRGLKAYILDERETESGNILIYTFMGHIVEIDPDELIYTGCD